MPFKPIETQEDFDAAIKERIERAQRAEREKFADYDSLKEKADKYDEAQQANKTELEKANERIAVLEGEKEARAKADKLREAREKVSKETGVPAELIHGEDEDAMRECAKEIAAYAKKPSAPKASKPGSFSSGGDDRDADMREFARQLLGKE